MTRRRALPTILTLSATALGLGLMGVTGCSTTRPSMADDPLTSNLLTPPPESGKVPAAPSSFAASKPQPTPSPRSMGGGSEFRLVSSSSHGPDYHWLRGRLGKEEGRNGGWYIEYANGAAAESDQYGGRLRFANSPRLDFLRVGDLVQVEGEVVQHNPGDSRFHVESIGLVSQ